MSDRQIQFMTREEFKEHCSLLFYAKRMLEYMECTACCKVDLYPDIIIGVLRVPPLEGDKDTEHDGRREDESIGFYLKEEILYVVNDSGMMQSLWNQLGDKRSQSEDPGQSLLLLFEELFWDDTMKLQHIEQRMGTMEEAVMNGIEIPFFQSFLQYRRMLAKLHFYYEQMINVAERMQTEYARLEKHHVEKEWEQFAGQLKRLHDYVNYLRDYVMQLRDMYQATKEARHNRSLNLLTVVTSLFLPLTLLTGWYGMNFKYMPEVGWKYGYLMVVLVAVLIVILEIVYIKKKKIP